MNKKMRVMSEKPLNAETPIDSLRTWTTDNDVFFKRNQGQIPEKPVELSDWRLAIDGLVKRALTVGFEEINRLPKVTVANTLECSGNGRSLFEKKAPGNPWTIGGVGNAIWGGVRLKELLDKAEPEENAAHVAFEGFDKPLGSAGIKFIRSIPLEKAVASTILAYEMNGERLPLEHGYPLRAVALGWTGANCVKWLQRVTLLEKPFEGFFMDRVYRVFQKGEDPKTGEIVTEIGVKSIITEPLNGETLPEGTVPVRGAAYAGEAGIERVEVSVDAGRTWHPVQFVGPEEHYAWRQWEYLWEVYLAGEYTIMVRAVDQHGNRQPETAHWNAHGYENNGIRDHAVTVRVI